MFNIIKSYFTENQIDDLLKEIKRLENQTDKKDYIWKYYEEDKKTISRIEKFIKHSPLLKQTSELFFKGSNYTLFKDKINFKYPGGNGVFTPHQDIVAAGWDDYGDYHINVAIPLQDTTLENGCIYFSDIKTDKKLTPRYTNITDDIVDPKSYKPYPTKKGDIILFDSYIPHKSFTNNSKDNRVIIFFTYVLSTKFDDVYEKYHNDKFVNNPPDINKEEGKKYMSNVNHQLSIHK